MPQHPAWLLIAAGAVLLIAGVVWLCAPSIPWAGRLPGDVSIERGNYRFYFPIVTCLLLSALLTGVSWLIRYLSR